MPAVAEVVFHFLPRREQRNIKLGILMDRHRAVFSIGRSDQPKLAALFFFGKSFLLVAGFVSSLVGHDPDLQQMGRLRGRRVYFAMTDSSSRAHALAVAGTNDR